MVAHRGASTEAPEHTLAAYQAALAAGAGALECDVRLTADGHLVCVHDRKVDRTSNGRGKVSTLELARLEELDFGAWHPSREEDRARNGNQSGDEEPDVEDGPEPNRVLTLRRLLELVSGYSRRVELAIEVKHPTRYAGLVERRLVELLDEFGWAHPAQAGTVPVRVMSFSRVAVKRIHRLAPKLDTVFLFEPIAYRLGDGVLPRAVPIAGPSIEILRTRPDAVRRMRTAGRRVHVWTVDDESDVDLCLELGVDAIITNRPREVRALVESRCTGADHAAGSH